MVDIQVLIDFYKLTFQEKDTFFFWHFFSSNLINPFWPLCYAYATPMWRSVRFGESRNSNNPASTAAQRIAADPCQLQILNYQIIWTSKYQMSPLIQN